MLSQFSEVEGKKTLKDLYPFPPDVYPVGRLDELSEGLLILTNDINLNHKLLDPKFKHKRCYAVCVLGQVTDAAIQALRKGVDIKHNSKNYRTLEAQAQRLHNPNFPERIIPFSVNKTLGTSWIELCLHEGKNRQVRKMTAKVGFPTLRLVRTRIEKLELKDLKQGEVREIDGDLLYKLLSIKKQSLQRFSKR